MPAPSVKIIEEARVAVPPTAAAALPREPIRLSALDAQWITLPLIQRVLIFVSDSNSNSSTPPFASAVAALHLSLRTPSRGSRRWPGGSCTFRPRATPPSTAALAPAPRAAGSGSSSTGVLPAETLAAQVTRLRGGVAVGVAMHHAAVDGRSVWTFLRAWAAACRGEGEGDAGDEPPTKFDRAVIRIPGGEDVARSVLRKWAPDLPVASVAGHFIRPNLSRRTFTITAQAMHRLKHRVAAELSCSPAHSAGTPPPPSSFVSVAALAWVSFVRSKQHPAGTISAADEVYLFFFADCRARLDPPPGEGYFGMCISGCLARATAADLLDADVGMGIAAAAVSADDPLAGWDWMSTLEQVDMNRLINLAGSTRFPAYEAADFGWGSPARTELVTMNHDGQVVLVAGKGGTGGIQAPVSLHLAHMDAYKAHFLNYFR